VFWVISVYFNIRNTLLKFFTLLPGHPVYIKLHIYLNIICTKYVSEGSVCFINPIPKQVFTAGTTTKFLGEMCLFLCAADEGNGKLYLIFNYASTDEDIWGNG
jgi:hypothetical protein